MKEFRFYYFTSNYGETISFYRDVLEFDLFRQWDRDNGDRGSIFLCPNRQGLIEIEEGTSMPSISGGLYIQVDDVDEWYAKTKRHGVKFLTSIDDTSYGHRNFKFADPSGLHISMFNYLKTQ